MLYLNSLDSLQILDTNTGRLFAKSTHTSIKPRTFISPLATILLPYLDFLMLTACLLLIDTLLGLQESLAGLGNTLSPDTLVLRRKHNVRHANHPR